MRTRRPCSCSAGHEILHLLIARRRLEREGYACRLALEEQLVELCADAVELPVVSGQAERARAVVESVSART